MWNLPGENVFAVSVDIAVCLEKGGECVVNVNVLDRVKFPKTDCVWSSNFTQTSRLQENSSTTLLLLHFTVASIVANPIEFLLS